MNLLEAKNLNFSYDQTQILKDISFELKKSEVLGIIGPNGGGKSTLLKIICGLLEGFSGEIYFNSNKHTQKVNHPNGEIAYLPQASKLNHYLPINCLDFVQYGELYRYQELLTPKEAIEFVGLQDKQEYLMRDLSGGEKQRAMLAKTLVQGPLLFALDEPTTGLDSSGQDQLLGLIEKVTKELNSAVIVIDHNINQVLKNCDKIICLNRTQHWHDKKDVLTKNVLESIYHCEFEHGLLHEKDDLGEHHACDLDHHHHHDHQGEKK